MSTPDKCVLGLVFMLGTCWGSFLHVCIVRIPAGLSVIAPRSRCPHCLKPLKWYDNIPLFGWLLLRARCRNCSTVVPVRYPLTELLTAVLLSLFWVRFPFDWVLLPYGVLLSLLIIASGVDVDEGWIPDRCSIGGMAAGLLVSFFLPILHRETSPFGGLLLSSLGLATGLGLLWLVGALGKLILKREAMGLGDVKLLGAIGAFLGWEGVLFAIFVAALLGSVIGLVLIAGGQHTLQARMPFGPYLATATIVWLLGGSG